MHGIGPASTLTEKNRTKVGDRHRNHDFRRWPKFLSEINSSIFSAPLQGFARMRNADLLAIGAFAHSRRGNGQPLFLWPYAQSLICVGQFR